MITRIKRFSFHLDNLLNLNDTITSNVGFQVKASDIFSCNISPAKGNLFQIDLTLWTSKKS